MPPLHHTPLPHMPCHHITLLLVSNLFLNSWGSVPASKKVYTQQLVNHKPLYSGGFVYDLDHIKLLPLDFINGLWREKLFSSPELAKLWSYKFEFVYAYSYTHLHQSTRRKFHLQEKRLRETHSEMQQRQKD